MDKINKIVKILKDYEGQLSDGYHFYSYDDSDETLEEIAKEILKVIEQEKDEPQDPDRTKYMKGR